MIIIFQYGIVLAKLKSINCYYHNDRITCSECENVGARNDARTGGFELGLGIVDDFVARRGSVLRSALLGGRRVDEDGAVAALHEAVVEMHPE